MVDEGATEATAATAAAEPVKAVSPIEKPLPPPPVEANEEREVSSKPIEKLARTTSSSRTRKKIAWRNKACFIAIPQDDKRGTAEAGYRLLTPADVEERMKQWEKQGYDTRGFSICADEDPSTSSELGGLSRPTYPDPREVQEDWTTGKCTVSIPDKAEWDAYVNWLQEEKLRALGVMLGEPDVQQSVSPAASLGQMPPAFPGLIASPPIPTSSAASNPFMAGNPFSPHFNQSSNPSAGLGSLASPASHFSVHTPFMGAEQNMMPGFPIPFQPTPPVQGAITPQSFFNARQSRANSTIPGNMANLSSMLSPVSPLNAEQAAFHAGFEDYTIPSKDAFGDQTGHHGFHDMHKDGEPFYRVQTPTQVPETFHSSNVELAQPTPRGHKNNLSETLQRGLDHIAQNDYHLEKSIDRQLDEDEVGQDKFRNGELFKSRWATDGNEFHPAPQMQTHFEDHQYANNAGDARTGESDIDTNPSLAGTPQPRQAQPTRGAPSWHETKPSSGAFVAGHRSKLSSSNLNVEAKEFNPTGAFMPLQTNGFQFGGGGAPAFSFNPVPTTAQAVPALAAAAPSVNAARPMFGFSGSNRPANDAPTTTNGFKFSAPFNVEAPEFNPGSSVGSGTAPEGSEAAGKGKIFDFDMSQISRPVKKSKAIPIIRPDDTADGELQDRDANGLADRDNDRPVPTDRNKRARRGDQRDDGDAEFSTSNHALSEAGGNARATSAVHHASAEGKENVVPGEIEQVPAGDKPSVVKISDPRSSPVSEATTWVAPDVKNDAEDIDVREPKSAISSQSEPEEPEPELQTADLQVDEVQDEEEEKEEEAGEGAPALAEVSEEKQTTAATTEISQSDLKSSILSATAKPFEFKPAVPEFLPTKTEPVPAPTAPEPKKANAGGLMASRYAVESPPPPPRQDEAVEPAGNGRIVEPPVQEEQVVRPVEITNGRQSDGESTSVEDLNAIMDQLNGDDDVGVERSFTPTHAEQEAEPAEPQTEQHVFAARVRSHAPSPSPSRGHISYMLNVPKLGSDMETQSHVAYSQTGRASGVQSPIRQLVSRNEHISDWDDMISSGEDEKLWMQTRLFDRRLNDLAGSAFEERVSSIEHAVDLIQQSVAAIAERTTSSRRRLGSTSIEVEDSDADDEDDNDLEDPVYRTRSPFNKKDRRMEKLRSIIVEALANHHDAQSRVVPDPAASASAAELAQLRESFAELKAFATEKLSQDKTTDLQSMIREVITLQRSQAQKSDAEEIGADSLMLQIDGLKSMLRIADDRAEQEFKARKDAQDSLAELQRLLKYAEEDASRHRDAAEAAETRLLQLKEEKIPHFEQVQSRSDALAEEHEVLQKTLSELSDKNIALEGTLDEYRVSADHFRREIKDLTDENKELRLSAHHLKERVEESFKARQDLRQKFDRLQDDMATAVHDIARDQAAWRTREEEHNAKYSNLRAAYERELKLREKLENDISELEQQEREAAKLKFIFGQSQQENAKLEELVANLRLENHDLQVKAARFEREFNEARESSRVEIQRTRTSMEADLEAANSQVNIVRAELEAQINRLQTQLDNVRMDADTSRERYEMLLEEANESRTNAASAAAEAKDRALEDQRKLHERVLNDLRERHARALHNSSEDRQRSDTHLMERLKFSDEKALHLQDRVRHLEEQLEIARSAARAAAEAAQSARAAPAPASSKGPAAAAPSMSFSQGSAVPEKISPQALRESILVLQDQLQQRESRIEELEQELSSVDKDAPGKIKEKDTEITWLRELLGVRIDDLQDIIRTVSQPSFDHHTVRDAAIRLKANLQMQLQERERASSSSSSPGQTFPSLQSISSLAASPRALPLAAAAAWGNWRKGRENSVASEQTPSKSSSNAGAFLSGLLTPPSSNFRQTSPHTTTSASASTSTSASASMTAPTTNGWRRSNSETRPLRTYTAHQQQRPLSRRQREDSLPGPPSTPPLLRGSSYDHDAEPASFAQNVFEEEEGEEDEDEHAHLRNAADEEDMMMVAASPKGTTTAVAVGIEDGPFGPEI